MFIVITLAAGFGTSDMSEAERKAIDANLATIEGIAAGTIPDATTKAVLALLGQLFKDVNRIADAAEERARPAT